jgi:hypothetical protein
MHSVKCDREKNRLYITLEGFISQKEAREVAEEVAGEVLKLSKGFDVISDLSKFSFGSVGGGASLRSAMEMLQIRGVRRVVRIAGKSRAGLAQFIRLTALFNRYKPIVVATKEQAIAALEKP